MKYRVVLVELAEGDLDDVYRWVAAHDGVDRAEEVLNHLEEACRQLGDFPLKGRTPPELKKIGVAGYREAISRPWRIVYVVEGNVVRIDAILDGRRDLETVLARRLSR